MILCHKISQVFLLEYAELQETLYSRFCFSALSYFAQNSIRVLFVCFLVPDTILIIDNESQTFVSENMF
jgi:hypothetical protein